MPTDVMRRTDIRIDKLTGYMDLMQLYAVEGEYNGRSLRVQITNGGAIEDQTGVQLHFGFKSTVTQNEGILVFSVVDATKGLYEVFYPAEMLEEPGTVVCAIRIVDSASISKTVNFTVQVRESVIHDGMEVPENSLKLIDKIVIDIADQEGRIAVMELNFKALSEMLTLNIPNMDVAVSTRSTQTSVDELTSNVGETADTGGGVNEGSAMAKLNKLLSKAPLYEKYDIRQTESVLVNSTEPLEFLNVSGEAVLIGYSLNNLWDDVGLRDAVTVKISVDGVVMYDIGHYVYPTTSGSSLRISAFSSFDDNFLINLYGNTPGGLYYTGHLILPSENHVEAPSSKSYDLPLMLVKPPISQNNLIVEAFKKPEATKKTSLSFIYGVKK